MKATELIRSYLRPQLEDEADLSARMLHQVYDNLFKSIVTGQWCNSSDGDVESPQGYFSLITIERAEAQSMFENFVTEDVIEEHYVWSLQKWPGQLAGHYVTQEDSNGIIRVYAHDSYQSAVKHYADLEQKYSAWVDDYDRHN